MKTIKQIADEIGVSKQAVQQKIKKEPLSASLKELSTTVSGVIHFDIEGENLIKSAFPKRESITKLLTNEPPLSESSPTSDSALPESLPTTESELPESKPVLPTTDSVLMQLLQDTVDTLKDQLKVKDKQIEEKDKQISDLTEANKNLSQSINADRHNELAETIIDGKKTLPDPTDENKTKPRLFWQFWKK